MKIGNLVRSVNRGVLTLLAFGGMLLYLSAADLVVSFKPAVSFEELLEEDKELKPGSHVKGDVVYALGYFASESTYTKRSDGSRSGSRKSGNYYMIPAATGCFALKCRQSDVEALDGLSEETFDYMMSGTEPSTEIFIEGKAEYLEGKLAGYYKEYLADLGYTEDEAEQMGEPLVVRYVNFMAVRIGFVLGLVLVLLGIFLLRAGYLREERGSGLRKAEDLPGSP